MQYRNTERSKMWETLDPYTNPMKKSPFVTASLFSAFILLLTLLNNCQKFEPSSILVISTDAIEELGDRTYKLNGTVVNIGEAAITEHGFCWSESQNPTVEGQITQLGRKESKGSYYSTISGLSANTEYHVRAYVTTQSGETYGKGKSFSTPAPAVPALTTSTISNITETSAQSGGTITTDGGATISARGVCWSASPNPTIADSHTTDGTGTGIFSSNLTGLACGIDYYVRAYATNSVGTAYGEQETFSTSNCPEGSPTVTTSSIGSITQTTAEGGGNITSDGGYTVTARGLCWSTSQNPTSTDPHTVDSSGTGPFTSQLIALTCGTTYYVRAYATNSKGTAYGSQETFTTSSCSADLPTVTTSSITSFTQTTAEGGGNVTSDGGADVTARGVCWSTLQNPVVTDSHTADDTGTGAFSSTLTDLTCETKYYVRAYATNEAGTDYGDEESFITDVCPPDVPTVTTSAITSITDVDAKGGGNVTYDGGAMVTARGICWSNYEIPTTSDAKTSDGAGTGSFTSILTNLNPSTTYYVRAYATNSSGTGYGNQVEFETLGEGEITDYDGNVYRTVPIGTQIWMAENLRVTHEPDGIPLTLITGNAEWKDNYYYVKSYTWYVDDSVYIKIYGYLYNHAAVMNGGSMTDAVPSGVQGICPDGWHIPSDGEWKQLEMHLGMSQSDADKTDFRGTDEGGQLKDKESGRWWSPNTGATNSSGFTAMPSGYRQYSDGLRKDLARVARYWSTTEDESFYWMVVSRQLNDYSAQVFRGSWDKNDGQAVRCVKDD